MTMTPLTSPSQRVGAAVWIAVKRRLSESGSVRDPQTLGLEIGRRIRGTYGAELRRLADLEPGASPEDLYRAVIIPGEYPWESAETSDSANPYSKARDRVRAQRPNAPSPVDAEIPDPDEFARGLAAARAGLQPPVPPKSTESPEERQEQARRQLAERQASEESPS